MRFSLTPAAILAFVAVVSAADPDPNFNFVIKPSALEKIPAGKTYKVEWTLPAVAAKGTVQISLLGGPTQPELQVLNVLATGYDNSKLSYDWAVDASLGAKALYGLIFELESNKTVFQFSPQFVITGGSPPSSSGSSSSGSSAPASSSSSSNPPASTSSATSVATTAATTSAPTTPPTSSSPPRVTSTTTSAAPPSNNGTTTARVPPNAAAGLSSNGALALVGGLAVLLFAL